MSKTLILDSSAVEHPAVNRRVVGSNPTRGVHGPLVKGLRHRLFTAVTRVRIPYGLLYNMEDYPSPAEGNGLENRQACKSVRGFESHILL